MKSTLDDSSKSEVEIEGVNKHRVDETEYFTGDDENISKELQVKTVYNKIRSVMVYGAKTLTLKKREERKLERMQMRMLRWVMSISLSLREYLKKNKGLTRREGMECIREVILRNIV